MSYSIRRRQLSLAAAAWCGGCALIARHADAHAAESDAARTYRTLRAVRGHFDGGRWSDDVDRWQGRKHVAMQTLADQMLRANAPAGQLRKSMGEPDAALEPGQPAHARALEQAQWLNAAPAPVNTTTLWLYRWRGQHDQLVFALTHGRVVAAGWLHELE